MKRIKAHSGFTLVELAIVLIILALLAGGLLVSLNAQRELTASAETQRRLAEARDALLGYAAVHGRLPCPASGLTGTTAIEAPPGGGACSFGRTGFLPAVTLGLSPTDAEGYAVDAWNNRIRYAITSYANTTYCGSSSNYCYATADGVKAVWNNNPTSLAPDLRICNTAAGATGTAPDITCASGTALATNAVAVIYSRGANGALSPSSDDEVANGDDDQMFVYHTPTPAGANEFDDLVIWLSPNILYNRMISAGRLP